MLVCRNCATGSFARVYYDSIRGKIVTDWKLKKDRFTLNVIIPANTTATVYVPAKNSDAVTESGKQAEDAEAVNFLRMEAVAAVYQINSGRYHFVSNNRSKTNK